MAERIALIYQGLTSHGGGKNYASLNRNPTASRIFASAHSAVPDIALLSRLCEASAYQDAEFASVANFAASVALTQIVIPYLTSMDMVPVVTTGNSQGLGSAVYAADGLKSFKQGVYFQRERGRLMQQVMDQVNGGIVVLGTNAEVTGKILETVRSQHQNGHVSISHKNSPYQTVVAGTKEALVLVADEARTHDIRAHRRLVSPPSHTLLMEPIIDTVDAITRKVVKKPVLPVVANTNGTLLRTAPELRREFHHQLFERVDWITGINTIFHNGAGDTGGGVSTFVVFAPGSDSGAKMIQEIEPRANVLIAGPFSVYKPDGERILTYSHS